MKPGITNPDLRAKLELVDIADLLLFLDYLVAGQFISLVFGFRIDDIGKFDADGGPDIVFGFQPEFYREIQVSDPDLAFLVVDGVCNGGKDYGIGFNIEDAGVAV